MIDQIFSTQLVEALGWTLIHSIWQGAAFAIMLVLILILLRKYTAQSRYIVSVGLLCAFFVTVSTTFWQQWLKADSRSEFATQIISNQNQNSTEVGLGSTLIASTHTNNKEKLNSKGEILEPEKSSWLVTFKDYFERHLPAIVTLWFLGILVLQLRFLGRLAYVQRLKHYGTQLFPTTWSEKIEELEGKLRIQKKVAYLTSVRIESPMVIGWLKPVVLMPKQLLNSLSETEIYAVLAHELAHIRREDFIINLIQNVLCNLFFYHPGVWWMSNRIDDEREHCCDDIAVAAIGQPSSYAKTLINVSELQLGLQQNPALAVAFSGKRERGGFTTRIKRLFIGNKGAGTFREGFTTACILVAALLLGAIATGRSTQSPDTPTMSQTEDKEIVVNDISLMKQTNQSLIQSNTIATGENNGEIEETEGSYQIPFTMDDTRIDALIMACEEGDIDFVKTLLESGIDVNGIGSEGYTPLMIATNNEEHKIIEYLLNQGADVNKAFKGWTALLEAADEGAIESMKHLLKAGAEVDYYWNQGSPTAISMAASEGKLECLKLLLEYGADKNGIGNSIPPLHIAAEENQEEIVDYLISQNININKKDASGRTALMYAASEGNSNIVKKLVSAGAQTLVVDSYGLMARDYAEDEDHYSIVKFLDANNMGPISNTQASSSQTQSNNNINQRIQSRNQLNHTRNQGLHSSNKRIGTRNRDLSNREPITNHRIELSDIHQATLEGKIEKVKRMVEEGVDVNSGDEYGRTPLHLASEENHNIDMGVLIDLGADINAQDHQGRTPLMYAAAKGKEGAAVFLVSRQANVNIEDVDGMRAYEWARSGGNPDLANFLGLITANNNESNMKSSIKIDDKEFAKNLKNQIRNSLPQDQIESDDIDDVVNQVMSTISDIRSNIQNNETSQATNNVYHLGQFNIDQDTPELIVVQAGNQLLKEGIDYEINYQLGRVVIINDDLLKQGIPISVSYEDPSLKKINSNSNSGNRTDSKQHETFHVTNKGYQLRQFDIDDDAPELFNAIRNGLITDCKSLLSNGVSVNASDDTGQTALMVAAKTNRIEIAKFLIEKGADVNLNSKSGLTALHYAALENNAEFAQLLLNNQATIDATMKYSSTDGNYTNKPIVWEYVGATPLLIAVESGNLEVVSVLIEAGANPNHTLVKNEYLLNEDRKTYLDGSEVMGIDREFLKEVKLRKSDKTWTPYKQAQLLNDPEILTKFPN